MNGLVYSYSNNMISVISTAAAKCYNKSLDGLTNDDKAEFIGRIIKTGHESILEHANIILYMTVDEKWYDDIIDIWPSLKYLNTYIYKDDNIYKLLIGGCVRSFKYIYRSYTTRDNYIFHIIDNFLSDNIDSRFFGDLIRDGVFSSNEPECIDDVDNVVCEGTFFKILNIDPISDICVDCNVFPIDTLLDFCTISIDFSGVSRIISQQYLRHDAAVTQESQRYVNYSTSKFNSPAKFKDCYDKDSKYSITFGGCSHEMTLQELGDSIIAIYPQLVEQGLAKEDARGYLPNNTQTRFVQTYTLRNFIMFLKLRVDPTAQAEIRQEALELERWFIGWMKENVYENINIYNYLEPVYSEIAKDNDIYYTNIDEEL